MESAVYRGWARALQLHAMESVEWTLADVIIKLRKKRQWGRRHLAKIAKVAYATMTRLETGHEMKEASIRKVAAALNLSLAELYALVPTAAPATDATTAARDAVWARLDRAGREQGVALLRSLDEAAHGATAPPPSQQQPSVTRATAGRIHQGKR
jgi:transcriptional regulator with XRE-family HTH domain